MMIWSGGADAPANKQERIYISVVIPSYNSAATISRCLEALERQEGVNVPYEVIVVDSSNDATPQMIRERFPWARLIHRDAKTPVGAARNIGIQAARGEIIAFYDADTVADAHWLAEISGQWAASNGQYIGIGGAVANGNPECVTGWISYLIEFLAYHPGSPRREVRGMPGCTATYHRRAFAEYGLYHNESYAGDDDLYNWQLIQAGETLLFEPRIRVSHLNRNGLRRNLRHVRHIANGVAVVRLKHSVVGAEWVRRARLLAPAYWLVRVARIFWRTLRYDPANAWRLIYTLPLAALGLIWFALGEFDALRATDDQGRMTKDESDSSFVVRHSSSTGNI